MKKIFLRTVFSVLLVFYGLSPAFSYMVKYKEDYYKLYHVHYQQYPDDCMENIYWLEKAVKADFCNPLYAMSRIETEKDWEKYRYLFMMHVNLKIIEQYLRLGRIYDKKVAHFYDAPWSEVYVEELQKTLSCYQTCRMYWQEAKLWAEKANTGSFKFLYLTDLQYWEDERERIATGDLDYEKTLNREITRVKKVIAEFEKMGKKY
ncbi:MAG: hypothetical protein J6Y93_04785 [Treponema sp.]|nr:hypothetical protein [Treponema sp.]